MSKVIFLDNQDSFTYNLVDELQSLGMSVDVYRNTVNANVIVEQLEKAQSAGESPMLFLSPGPGAPSQAGCMMTLLDKTVGRFPIVGICLGHQALAEHFGGKVVLAGETIHGKSSLLTFEQHAIFNGINHPMPIARYHSLKVEALPDNLRVIGWYQSLPMVMIDERNQVIGIQFHPESILTTQGTQLLANSVRFLNGISGAQHA